MKQIKQIILDKNCQPFDFNGQDSFVYAIKKISGNKIICAKTSNAKLVLKVYKFLNQEILEKYIQIQNFLAQEFKNGLKIDIGDRKFKVKFEKYKNLVKVILNNKQYPGAIQNFVKGATLEEKLQYLKNNYKLQEHDKLLHLMLEINKKLEKILQNNNFNVNMWRPFKDEQKTKLAKQLFNNQLPGYPQITMENIKFTPTLKKEKNETFIVITDIAANIQRLLQT